MELLEVLKERCNLLTWDTEEQWRDERRNYIGGSDIGSILGYNPYSSPYQVYASKLGIGEEFTGNLATELGHYLEPFIREKFVGLLKDRENLDCKVYKISDFMFASKEHNFMSANLDGVVEIDGEYSILEIKTASEMVGKKFEDDEIPDSYYLQIQWYLGVTGFKKGYIAYLVGNRKLDYKEVPRNEQIIEEMMMTAKSFWENHVLAKEPPMFTFADTEVVKAMYTIENEGELKEFDEETENVIIKWRQLKDEASRIKKDIDDCENKIKGALGTAEKGIGGGGRISWKLQKKDGFFVKPSESRVLRYSKIK